MSTDGYVQDTRIGRFSTALGDDALFARRIDVEEGVSELFTLRVEAISEDENVDFDAAIGRNATFSARTPRGIERHFDGIVTEAEWIGRYDENHLYRILMRPWLWLLSKTSDCRIFHNKSVVEIITEVMGAYPFADFEDALSASYPKVEYTVQYRESDLAFILRLMEKNGISYFFRHKPGAHTMVLCDGQSSFDEARGSARPWIERLDRMQADEEYVFHWVRQRRFTSGEFTNTSYNFKTPDANMRSTARGLMGYANNDLEVYDYPGKHDVKGDGEQYAKVTLEAEQAADAHRVAEGDLSSCHPGEQMALESHPIGDENAEWLMLKARHRYHAQDYRSGGPKIAQEQNAAAKRRSAAQHADAIAPGGSSTGRRIAALVNDPSRAQFDQGSLDDPIEDEDSAGSVEDVAGEDGLGASTVSGMGTRAPYHGSYEFIKADAAFRPPVKTSRTHIYGPQTATVVGEGEIDCDEYGRILVKFHWDRLEDISRRVRVSQNWASGRWGGVVIPRIGMEVMVEFMEGDPDHPIVTGCVYHQKNMPPYELPKHKTRSVIRSDTHKGTGFNEMTFEDEKGIENMFFHAQKDHTSRVLNNRTARVDSHDVYSVGANRAVEVAKNQKHEIGGSLNLTVGGTGAGAMGLMGAVAGIAGNTAGLLGQAGKIAGGAGAGPALGAFAGTIGSSALGFLGGGGLKSREGVVDGPSPRADAGVDLAKSGDGVGKAAAGLFPMSGIMNTVVGKFKSDTIGIARTEQIGVAKVTNVGATQMVNVGKFKKTTVGEEFVIEVGKSKFIMRKDGTVIILGTNFNFTASGPVQINGSVVDLNKPGS